MLNRQNSKNTIDTTVFKTLMDQFLSETITIPPHQREFIWEKYQKYINQLLSDILLSKGDHFYGLYVLNNIQGMPDQRSPWHEEEVEDAQQRLKTCVGFVQNTVWITKPYGEEVARFYRQEYEEEIAISSISDERRKQLQKIVGALATGKFPRKLYYRDLPRVAQNIFNNHVVHVRRTRLTADDKINNFLRMQNHVPLQHGDVIHTIPDTQKGSTIADDVRTALQTLVPDYCDPFPALTKMTNLTRDFNLALVNIIQSLSTINPVDYNSAGAKVVEGAIESGNAVAKNPHYQRVTTNLRAGLIALANLENNGSFTLNPKGAKDQRYNKTYMKSFLVFVGHAWHDPAVKKYVKARGIEALLTRCREIYDKAKGYKSLVNSGQQFNTATVPNWPSWVGVYGIFAGTHNRTAIDKYCKSLISLL
tara:strand:+ start:415 stop:1677 length:1263 start_codon:yes stop_codon:yes gene_type:complete